MYYCSIKHLPTGTQLSQTAHYALQTPYQIFGLGDTPNIIDEMEVGIPNPENQVCNLDPMMEGPYMAQWYQVFLSDTL